MTQPEGFDTYWDGIDAELARLDPALELTHIPLRSTESATVYEARMTSIGPYRIFGWLSVPTDDGPFPALLHTPGYGSVVMPPPYDERQRYIVLSIAHRGQRNADSPYAASYPGLLTDGILDPLTFIFRGIVTDLLRAAEVLLDYPLVDSGRIGIVGNDLALITAARRPSFRALQVTDWLFYRACEARHHTTAYPIEELNDYLRAYPDRADHVALTLSHFDARHHAPRVTAATQLRTGAPKSLISREWLEPVANALGGDHHWYDLTFEGGTDRDATDAWMADMLGTHPAPRVWPILEQAMSAQEGAKSHGL